MHNVQASHPTIAPNTAAMSRHLDMNYTSATTQCLFVHCIRVDRAAQPVPLYIKDPKR
jgi:hypothetical protein